MLDMAFEHHGFTVVRGPDLLWGGDVKCFHAPAGLFDGVIGGPPCKAFSSLRHIVAHNHSKYPDKYLPAENLIPEFERIVAEAQPAWFLMENVPAAPQPEVPGYAISSIKLNNRWVPGATAQNRNRRFSFGVKGSVAVSLNRFIRLSLFEPIEFEYAVTAASSRGGHAVPIRLNSGGKPKRLPKSREGAPPRSVSDYEILQGLPQGFLSESPFTVAGKKQVIGNGVPLPLGLAVADAIKAYLSE